MNIEWNALLLPVNMLWTSFSLVNHKSLPVILLTPALFFIHCMLLQSTSQKLSIRGDFSHLSYVQVEIGDNVAVVITRNVSFLSLHHVKNAEMSILCSVCSICWHSNVGVSQECLTRTSEDVHLKVTARMRTMSDKLLLVMSLIYWTRTEGEIFLFFCFFK